MIDKIRGVAVTDTMLVAHKYLTNHIMYILLFILIKLIHLSFKKNIDTS